MTFAQWDIFMISNADLYKFGDYRIAQKTKLNL